MTSLWDNRICLLNHNIRHDDLHHGDHIYVHRGLYTFSHHGIYDAVRRKVIHFTQENGVGSRFASVRSMRKMSKTLLAFSFSGVCKGTTISEDTLEDFLETNDVTALRLYTYRATFYSFKLSGTCTTLAANDPAVAVEIARWFLDRPEAFGKYKLKERNCESFANFCKTTRVTAAELSQEYDRVGDDDLAWQQYLSSSGSAHTEQRSLLTYTAPLRFVAKVVLSTAGKAFEKEMFASDSS